MRSALGSSSSHYERFFQTSDDLLCLLSERGSIERVNRAFCNVLGYTEDTLLGQTFVAILHEEDRNVARAFFEGRGDASTRLTVHATHRDLSLRKLIFSLSRVTEDQAIYGVGRQVFEEESVQQRRRRSELLQTMQETGRIGGWEIDMQTNQLYWTEETYRIHEVPVGFKPNVETAIHFYSPEAIPLITAAVEQAMQGTAYDLELQIITAKGRLLWVRAAGHAVFEEGRVVRLIGAFQDIDTFKRREIELEEKLAIIEQQRTAIHAMSAPIIQVWDGVLALPIVGELDEARASEMTSRILDSVVNQQAKYAILDLTGVDTVDEGTADHLVRIIRAVQLLGAQSIVTGIRPAVAQTIIMLGAGFAGARTVSNLREAIKVCMRGR